jgi:hypothetical protein
MIRNLRGLEMLWGARGDGRLSLQGVKVNDDRICVSEENAYHIFGIREFWKVRSPITVYRVYREEGEVFVEFEGERGKEEEEPPKKKKRLSAGICRRTEYDSEKMEPYPRCSERLKSKLSEKGLIMFILKDREEEPDSDTDAYLTPTKSINPYENVRRTPEYENVDIASTFNIDSEK